MSELDLHIEPDWTWLVGLGLTLKNKGHLEVQSRLCRTSRRPSETWSYPLVLGCSGKRLSALFSGLVMVVVPGPRCGAISACSVSHMIKHDDGPPL